MSNIIAETNDDFSHNQFELLTFILAQKLTILEGGLHWWPFFLIFELGQSFLAQIDREKNRH